jgi:hypothetical protein
MGSSKQISALETLESRTMMSTVALPHFVAAAKAPAVHAPLHKASPLKTVNPSVTDNSITYKSFANDPLFASNGPTMSDVNQGDLGDCYLLSTLSSVVKTDSALIKKDIVADGNGIFTVTFAKTTKVNVTADLPVFADGQLAYAKLGNQNSLWVAIYEKAYAVYANAKTPSYNTINGGWMSSTFSALGLKSQTIVTVTTASKLATTLAADLKAHDFTTLATKSTLPSGSPLVAGHAYDVVSATSTTVTLRNPWGQAAADDGMITITADQAFRAFAGVVISHA